jgi:heat shock protein HtpX
MKNLTEGRQMNNNMKTLFLLAALTAVIVLMGNLIGGRSGMILAFIIALGMNFFSYWFSDKIVLKMYGAQEVDASQAPELHQIVEELSREAGIPKPRVYVVPNESPNAFATGRDPWWR